MIHTKHLQSSFIKQNWQTVCLNVITFTDVLLCHFTLSATDNKKCFYHKKNQLLAAALKHFIFNICPVKYCNAVSNTPGGTSIDWEHCEK